MLYVGTLPRRKIALRSRGTRLERRRGVKSAAPKRVEPRDGPSPRAVFDELWMP